MTRREHIAERLMRVWTPAFGSVTWAMLDVDERLPWLRVADEVIRMLDASHPGGPAEETARESAGPT